jgi:hypothetical protein
MKLYSAEIANFWAAFLGAITPAPERDEMPKVKQEYESRLRDAKS